MKNLLSVILFYKLFMKFPEKYTEKHGQMEIEYYHQFRRRWAELLMVYFHILPLSEKGE